MACQVFQSQFMNKVNTTFWSVGFTWSIIFTPNLMRNQIFSFTFKILYCMLFLYKSFLKHGRVEIKPNPGSVRIRLNPGLPHCRWILYQLSCKGSPRILEWVVYPFSRGSSQTRNLTGVSCIVGGFFTNWGIRETQEIKQLQ